MVQTLSKGALFVQSITLFHVIGIITSDSIDPIIQSLLIKNSVIIWPWNNSIKI